MMRRYAKLRSSSSAKSRERDTYLFQDAEESSQIAETLAGSAEVVVKSQISNKSVEKSDNESPRKHFMASIRKLSSLRDRQQRPDTCAEDTSACIKDNSDAGRISELLDLRKSIRRPSSLSYSLPFSTKVSDPPVDKLEEGRKKPAAEDAPSALSLLRSTSARDASLEVSVKDIGSLETALHRALSVREGRLKSDDGLNAPSVIEKQSRIVLNGNIASVNGFLSKDYGSKEQIKQPFFEQIFFPDTERRSFERRQESLAAGAADDSSVVKSQEEAELNQGFAQKPMHKTQSMRYSQISKDIEEAWVPARNSSYFGPIAIPKGSIFGGFNSVNLYHSYSQMDRESVFLECRVCGCELDTGADDRRWVEDCSEVCASCQNFPTFDGHPADSSKTVKKKGGLLRACRRIFRLRKKNSFP